MTQDNQEFQMSPIEKIKKIQEYTNQIYQLYGQLVKKGITGSTWIDIQKPENITALETLLGNISVLNNETLNNTFLMVFGEGTQIYNALPDNSNNRERINNLKPRNSESVANNDLGAAEQYLEHLNDSVQGLAQLDLMLTRLIDAGVMWSGVGSLAEFKKFRDEVRNIYKLLSHQLTDKNGILYHKKTDENGQPLPEMSNDELAYRLNTFLQSEKFQAIQYGIADVKFRFTNEIKELIDKSDAKFNTKLSDDPSFSQYLGAQQNLSVYEAIRRITQFTKLESAKDKKEILQELAGDGYRKIANTLAYVDGMISVRSLIEAKKHKGGTLGILRPQMDREKVANGILMGLDADLGFFDEIKKKYADQTDAYISGCVEECLIESRPDVFRRAGFEGQSPSQSTKRGGRVYQDTAASSYPGQMLITKESKSTNIKTALGINLHNEYASPPNFNLEELRRLYDNSTKLSKQFHLQPRSMPLYLILGAIKPLSIENPSEVKSHEIQQLVDKVTFYQRVLETMRIGMGIPSRGRSRVNLNLNEGNLDLKEQARQVFDRLLHFYSTHQRELQQLTPDKIKQFQEQNRQIFDDMKTFIGVRATKKLFKGFAKGVWSLCIGTVPEDLFDSAQKRRAMQYQQLIGRTIAQLPEDKLEKKFAVYKEKPNPEVEYMKDLIDQKSSRLGIKILGTNPAKKKELNKIYKDIMSMDFKQLILEQKQILDPTEQSTLADYRAQIVYSIITKFKEFAGIDDKDNQFVSTMRARINKEFDDLLRREHKYEPFIEKFNSPNLLLMALDEQIGKEKPQTDEHKIIVDMVSQMKIDSAKSASGLSPEDITRFNLEFGTKFMNMDPVQRSHNFTSLMGRLFEYPNDEMLWLEFNALKRVMEPKREISNQMRENMGVVENKRVSMRGDGSSSSPQAINREQTTASAILSQESDSDDENKSEQEFSTRHRHRRFSNQVQTDSAVTSASTGLPLPPPRRVTAPQNNSGAPVTSQDSSAVSVASASMFQQPQQPTPQFLVDGIEKLAKEYLNKREVYKRNNSNRDPDQTPEFIKLRSELLPKIQQLINNFNPDSDYPYFSHDAAGVLDEIKQRRRVRNSDLRSMR